MKITPPFLATGIGSLPYTDVRQALALITSAFAEFPHWPQLPSQGAEEGLIGQFVSPLVNLGLVVDQPGRAPYFDTEQADWVEKLTEFYNRYLMVLDTNASPEALAEFAFPPHTAQGFYAFTEAAARGDFRQARYLKGQITGPVTMGLQLTDQARKAAYYDEQLRDIVVKTCALQAFWQARELLRHNLPVLVLIDEPGLYAYGQSTHITLESGQITADLAAVADSLHQAGALAGVHVCAGTDWPMVLHSGIDVLSFDAYSYFTGLSVYPDELKSFLAAGGILAWGLIPTAEEVLGLTSRDLVARFHQYIDLLAKKGLDRHTLLTQALITPSCGVGSLSRPAAERAYSLTQEAVAALRQEAAASL